MDPPSYVVCAIVGIPVVVMRANPFDLIQAGLGVERLPDGGVLPSQWLRKLAQTGTIDATVGIDPRQIQPASLDLRLGNIAYRINASFLPGKGTTVLGRLKDLALYTIDLDAGAVLERDCVYIVPLQENVRLGSYLSANANP